MLRLDLSPSLFTFHGPKKMVQKMQDVLLTNGILGKFMSTEPDISVTSHDSYEPTVAGNLSKNSGTTDVTEQLEKLGNLLEKELITEEEFNEKKKELLAKL